MHSQRPFQHKCIRNKQLGSNHDRSWQPTGSYSLGKIYKPHYCNRSAFDLGCIHCGLDISTRLLTFEIINSIPNFYSGQMTGGNELRRLCRSPGKPFVILGSSDFDLSRKFLSKAFELQPWQNIHRSKRSYEQWSQHKLSYAVHKKSDHLELV